MLTVGQQIALNQYLHEYPLDKDFKTVLDLLVKENDLITIIETYEDFDGSQLEGEINHLALVIDEAIN